jgi:hypothetical protein
VTAFNAFSLAAAETRDNDQGRVDGGGLGSINGEACRSSDASIWAGATEALLRKCDDGVWGKLGPSIITGLAGLFGVLCGGIINMRLQRAGVAVQAQLAKDLAIQKANQETDLAERRTRFEIGNSLVQWQLKQLSELYGPMHALLGQSKALYVQMNRALILADGERFRRANNGEFQILTENAGWVRFRTVLHLHKVYGKAYGVDDYFDAIVAIGTRLQSIIEQKAGFARPEEDKLASVFGQYLAHYTVLMRLHSSLKVPSAASGESRVSTLGALRIDESAEFPQEIERLVATGFRSINSELGEWKARAAAVAGPRQ